MNDDDKNNNNTDIKAVVEGSKDEREQLQIYIDGIQEIINGPTDGLNSKGLKLVQKSEKKAQKRIEYLDSHRNQDERDETIIRKALKKVNKKRVKRFAIFIGACAILYLNKTKLYNTYRFVKLANDTHITVEEMSDAIDGMEIEKNNSINEYNDTLNKITSAELPVDEGVDEALSDLELNYTPKEEDFLDKVAKHFVDKTPTMKQDECILEIIKDQEDMIDLTEKPRDYEKPNVWKNFQNTATTIGSWFGGRTVTEKEEQESIDILKELTNFIFYNQQIKGVTFDELTSEQKIDVINITLDGYRDMERRFADIKSELDENTIYTTLDSRLLVLKEYFTQTAKLEDNYEVIINSLGDPTFGNSEARQR